MLGMSSIRLLEGVTILPSSKAWLQGMRVRWCKTKQKRLDGLQTRENEPSRRDWEVRVDEC